MCAGFPLSDSVETCFFLKLQIVIKKERNPTNSSLKKWGGEGYWKLCRSWTATLCVSDGLKKNQNTRKVACCLKKTQAEKWY